MTIGSQILVTEAARQLKISFHPPDHENLLKLLRGLRQGVKLAGMNSTGHEEFASSFRGRLEEQGRLDLGKTFRIEKEACGRRRLASDPQITSQFRAPQIKVTVFEAEFFMNLGSDFGIIDLEREDIGGIQYLHFSHENLDMAGRDLVIIGPLGTLTDFAPDGDHTLTVQARRSIKERLIHIGRIKDSLGPPLPVPNIDEKHSP